jgi:hypothetical protein
MMELKEECLLARAHNFSFADPSSDKMPPVAWSCDKAVPPFWIVVKYFPMGAKVY